MISQNDQTKTRIGQVIDEREQAEKEVAGGILDFYLKRYAEVYVVICVKCDTKLCLEVKDPAKLNPHHLYGRTVIELSPKYVAHRRREDDCEGYQCKCGQDNRWAYIEWQTLRHGGDHMYPHEVQAVKDAIAASDYHPDVKIKGKDTIIEGKFIVRKLK
jgi:hypothetical protein